VTNADRSARPILLVGAGGQLGSALATRLGRLGPLVCSTRADVDLERPDDIRSLVRRVAPSIVVNAAAYTAVDDAERDQVRCAQLNAIAPTVLAEEAARLDAPLVHFSTNYVFDGAQRAPYDETAPTSPLSVYGATKAEGDRGVAGASRRHVIVRTAAVYGGAGRNFMRRMLALARERDELRVVDDQLVSPTPVWMLADATLTVVDRLRTRDHGVAGIYHVTTVGAASWYEFTRRILALDPDRATQRVRAVVAVASADYPTPARRPPNGVLDVARFERDLGVQLPRWDDALGRTLGRDACR
jgi:dTDP-4-dehydrorhamnose reductase